MESSTKTAIVCDISRNVFYVSLAATLIAFFFVAWWGLFAFVCLVSLMTWGITKGMLVEAPPVVIYKERPSTPPADPQKELMTLAARVTMRQIQLFKSPLSEKVRSQLLDDNIEGLTDTYTREGSNLTKAKAAFLKSKGMTEEELPQIPK